MSTLTDSDFAVIARNQGDGGGGGSHHGTDFEYDTELMMRSAEIWMRTEDFLFLRVTAAAEKDIREGRREKDEWRAFG